jgi:hypothetical protein
MVIYCAVKQVHRCETALDLAAHKEKMSQQFAEAFFCASRGIKIGQIFSLIIVTFFYILAYNGT